MATCSITDAFSVDAELFYKTLEEAKKVSEEVKKHPEPDVIVTPMSRARIIELFGEK